MAKLKTDKQIQQEILKLKALRHKIKPRGMFGDNLMMLDAMVQVLEDKMNPSQIDITYYPDETDPDCDESEIEIYNAAMIAYKWMNGEKKKLLADPKEWPLK